MTNIGTAAVEPDEEIVCCRGPRGRSVWIASGVSALLIIVAGVALVLELWISFRRFDVAYLIPWAAGMAVLRDGGASGAALVTCLHVTAILHDRLRNASPSGAALVPGRERVTIALLAGSAVPILYVPVSALALGSAMMTAYLGLGLRPAMFFHLVEAGDVGYGLVAAIIMGAVPALWSIAGSKLLSSRRRGIGFKLFVTWIFVVGLSIVARIGSAVVDPREDSSRPIGPPPILAP